MSTLSPSLPSLARGPAAAADLRALWAATVKEWRILWRYPLAFVSMLFWPLAMPGIYVLQAHAFAGGSAASLQAFASRTGTASIAGFLYVGLSMYMWLSQVLWGPGTALRNQQVQGQLEALFLSPASRMAVLFGPVGSALVVAAWMFAVIGVALRLGFGVEIGLVDALRAVAVVVVGAPAMYGLGALFSVAVLVFREVNGLVQLLRGLFTCLCGMTYPVVMLPGWARSIALSLPPTYIIGDVRRALLTGTDLVQMGPDLLFLAGAGAVLCVLAAWALRAAERSAHHGGGLNQY